MEPTSVDSAASARSERNRHGALHGCRSICRGWVSSWSAAARRAFSLGLSVLNLAGLTSCEVLPDADPTPCRDGGKLDHPLGAGPHTRRRRAAGPGLPPSPGRSAGRRAPATRRLRTQSHPHPCSSNQDSPAMRTALYARVSTERQERRQTIVSQLTALQAWAVEGGHAIAAEHVFRDEGYSGSRLDRPGLDALRDAVRDGAVQGERFRRGKLQRARNGHYLAGRAPYGYRYVPRQDAVPGHLVVDEPEADLVRMLYGWLVDEQTTIRQILKRLNAGPWLPRSGRHAWSPSTVHHILADPIYVGTAYANRYAYVPAAKPRAQRGPHTGEATCRRLRPREQWIAISVPALVDQQTWDRAQAQLARNAALSFRHNARHSYLLRCLLTCEVCGLAMYGVTRPATATKPERQYYECRGKDCVLSARTAACPSRHVKAEEIEPVVWNHVTGLLADPDRLLAQFDHLAATAEAGSARDQAAERQLQARLDRTVRADKRLLDAYQAGAVTLAELSERRQFLASECQALERQQEEQARLRQQRLRAEAVRRDLAAFCSRIHSRLDEATFADKQAILQLVIERIIVGNGRLEIRQVIPLRPPPPQSGRSGP